MRSVLVKVYLSPDEKEQLRTMSARMRLSVSDMVRRIATNAGLPDPGRYEAIRELVRINADLARLGNLLKLGIDEENLERDKAMELLAEIRMRPGRDKAEGT